MHCIGDSHASFFSGRNNMQPAYPDSSKDILPSFRSYRLGAVLAYSLKDFGSTEHGREKIIDLLKKIPLKSNILLCFGEIDCRVHLLIQSRKQGKSLEEVVEECVKRYFSFILEIKNKYNVFVWGVIASTPSERIIDPRYPHFGSCLERNETTRIFNEKLQRLSSKNGIKFISIFEQLLLEDGLTDGGFYVDDIHLSQRAMPLAIKKFRDNAPELHIQMFNSGVIKKMPIIIQDSLFKLRCIMRTKIFIYKEKLIATTWENSIKKLGKRMLKKK